MSKHFRSTSLADLVAVPAVFRPAPLLSALAAVLGALAGAPALADTELPPVVVTPSRSEQLLGGRLADVSIIDAATLARSGQTSLGELLQQQHGLELTSSGGPQGTTGVFIRGANPSHTLLLIDGQRIGSATAGGASLNAIPLDQVERIEILRGPASSLYGADAIGGVINIITRKGRGPLSFNARLGAGSNDTYTAHTGLSGMAAGFSYALQAGHEQSRGFSSLARPDPGNMFDSFNPDHDGYERHSASGRLAWDWATGHTLAVQMLRSEQDGQFDGVNGYDDRERITVSNVALSSTDQISASWLSRLRAGQTGDDSTTDYGGFVYRYRTRQLQASWQNDLTLGEKQSLILGVDYLKEKIDADYIGGTVPGSRETTSLLGVHQLQAGNHRLQLNLRHDESSQYGGETTGAVSYGYQLNPVLRLSGSVGTAFRAPSYNDLYYPGYGQTGIRPESALNRELGFYLNGQGFDGSVVAFHNRVDDLIATQNPCTTPGYDWGCAANIREARLQGVSVAWRQQWGDTGAAWSADWQEATDVDTGKRLIRRADVHGSFSLTQKLDDWLLGAELQGSGRRYDDAANTLALGGYGVLNLHATWQLARAWSMLVRWNNALDKDYALADRYATAGSNVFVALLYRR